MHTLLKLDEYFFPVVQVVASPEVPEEDLEMKFNVEVSLHESKEGKLYQVAVDLHSSHNSDSNEHPYDIHLVVIGVFVITDEFSNIRKLLYVDGASMLYSAAREFLITITSRGPWQVVKLPVFSFLEKYKEECEGEVENSNTEKHGT